MASARTVLCSTLLFALCATAFAGTPAGPWDSPPALSAPSGTIVNVTAGNAADLANKIRNAGSNTTVLIPAGTYQLTAGTGPLRIGANGNVKNVALRGATGNRGDVIIRGPGMSVDTSGSVPHCLMIENAQDVLVANLSLGDVWYHPVTIQGTSGADRVRVYNCRIFDAGEQFLKSNPFNADGSANPQGYSGASDGIVEYCVFEYTTTARHWYTEGVDVHGGHRWIVRNNLFQNIRGPSGAQLVGGAIDFWNRSTGTLVENNTIYNCEVGIRLGILDRAGYNDHEGGIIRNNFFYRAPGTTNQSDVGIIVNDSPNTQVLHNTVLLNGTYTNAIEVRFGTATNVRVANNLCDAAIVKRDSATGTHTGNLTSAPAALFTDAPNANLHLKSTAIAAIDKVPAEANATLDRDGQARPFGTSADVGADEFSTDPPAGNQPPQVTSPATATPNPATVLQNVNFSVAAIDPEGATLTYAWDFGGAGTAAGPTATFAFPATGTFLVTVTIRDSQNASTTSSISVTITTSNGGGGSGGGSGDVDTDGDRIANSSDTDDDNDGVSDANEVADGTDPLSPSSMKKTPMTLTKAAGSMKFDAASKDSCSANGILPALPVGFDPNGATASINIGGASATFVLDGKGRAKNASGSFTLKLKRVRNKTTKKSEFPGGDAPFMLKLSKGTWSDDWRDEGVDPTADAKNAALPITVDLAFGGRVYTATADSLYSGKADKSGRFKFSKKP